VAETCTGSAFTCPVNVFKANTIVCSTCVANTGASGACKITGTGYKCSGTANTCTTSYGCTANASTAGNVWNGSAWAAGSASLYCVVSGYKCSGQQIYRDAYGCNTTGSCGTTDVGNLNGAACTGPESGSVCTAGSSTCTSGQCSDGLDNDSDGYIDGKDSGCGGCGKCTSGTCCITATGCYLPSTTICSDCTPSASANSCSASCTQYKCTGSSSTCGTTNPQTKTAYASSGYVYTGSGTTQTAASCSNYCGLSAYQCVGDYLYNHVPHLERSAYGCNGSGSCNTSLAKATCTQDCTYGCSGTMCNSSCPETCAQQLTGCGWWYMCQNSSMTWCGCPVGYDCSVNYPYPEQSMGSCEPEELPPDPPDCTPQCSGKLCGSGGCYDTIGACGVCPSVGFTCCDSVTWTCQKPVNCTPEAAPEPIP
jgi:hypothetical protein